MILRIAIIVLAACTGPLFVTPARANEDKRAAVQNQDVEFSAQQRRRPQIRVYRYPQPPFWEYPRPGTYSWPGPGAKRDCRAWYVIEHRPSGSVMTPRMRCEWVPG